MPPVAAAPTPTPAVALPWLPWLRRQLYDELQPWTQALSHGARFSLGGSSSDTPHDRPLHIQLSTDDDTIHMRALEAIELFALLGGVDPTMFGLYIALAAARESSWLDLSQATTMPLQVSLMIPSVDDFPPDITGWCERFVTGGVEATASEDYVRVRGLLESAYATVDAAYANATDTSRVTRNALVVRVDVHAYRGDFESCAQQFAQVATTQLARETMASYGAFRPNKWHPIFRVTEVYMPRPDSISSKAFLFLHQIVSCGIQLECLWIDNMDIEPASAAVFAQGLQTLVGTPTRRRDDPRRSSCVEDIRLLTHMSERTISAVFSALMTSQSVRMVTVNQSMSGLDEDVPDNRSMTEEKTRMWKWVAVSLFSRHASHQITSIQLHVQDLNLDDVAAFEVGLAQPKTVMFESSHVEEKQPLRLVTARHPNSC